MNGRLKEVRKYYKMTLEEFGKRLGVTKTAISRLENGERNITEQMILSVSREFRVSENWLRTGEGDMFLEEFREDEYMAYATEIGNGASDRIKKAIIKYGRLSPENKKIIDDALDLLTEILKEE